MTSYSHFFQGKKRKKNCIELLLALEDCTIEATILGVISLYRTLEILSQGTQKDN
jgi:hypothetical protein